MLQLQRTGASTTIVTLPQGELFYSYNTLVGFQPKGERFCYFHRDGKAGSRTTAKHITQWLDGRESVKVTEHALNVHAGFSS